MLFTSNSWNALLEEHAICCRTLRREAVLQTYYCEFRVRGTTVYLWAVWSLPRVRAEIEVPRRYLGTVTPAEFATFATR